MQSEKDPGKIVVGKGQWVIDRKSKIELDNDAVILNFSDIDGKIVNFVCNVLKIQRAKDNINLFFYVEDEGGERFVFERMTAQAASQDVGK